MQDVCEPSTLLETVMDQLTFDKPQDAQMDCALADQAVAKLFLGPTCTGTPEVVLRTMSHVLHYEVHGLTLLENSVYLHNGV